MLRFSPVARSVAASPAQGGGIGRPVRACRRVASAVVAPVGSPDPAAELGPGLGVEGRPSVGVVVAWKGVEAPRVLQPPGTAGGQSRSPGGQTHAALSGARRDLPGLRASTFPARLPDLRGVPWSTRASQPLARSPWARPALVRVSMRQPTGSSAASFSSPSPATYPSPFASVPGTEPREGSHLPSVPRRAHKKRAPGAFGDRRGRASCVWEGPTDRSRR